MPEPVSETIQADFVAMRQADPKNVTAETLHHLMNVARLWSLSKGEMCMSLESWHEACALDARRAAMLNA